MFQPAVIRSSPVVPLCHNLSACAGPKVFRLDTLWVLAPSGWVPLSAVLDPTYHNGEQPMMGKYDAPMLVMPLGCHKGALFACL